MNKKKAAEATKNYQATRKAVTFWILKDEKETWKHDLPLATLARLLLRAYFAGKIDITL